MCALLLLGSVLTTTAFAQDIDLVGDASKWTAGTDGGAAKMTLGPTPDAKLAVKVESDGGNEDYPKLRLSFPEPQDWERFMRLRWKLRVTSADPGVTEKNITFVFYDENTRREDLADRPMTQQCVGRSIPLGKWVKMSDWLLNINRSTIRQLDLYLYEVPPGSPHTYTWEVAELRLEGVGEQAVAFDTEVYSNQTVHGERSQAAGEVKTDDGLALRVGRKGDVQALLDGKAAGVPADQPTGILVRDATTNDPLAMVGGEVTRDGGKLTQRAKIEKLGLQVDAEFRPGKEYLEIAGTVTDLRGEDRAVTLAFAAPLADEPWTWWDSMSVGRQPGDSRLELTYLETGMGYGQNGMHSKYPIGAVTRAETGGLTLGVRMDEPVVHRIAYNPELRLFFISLDFGLVAGKTLKGTSLSQAPFRILLYRHDPAWGFRSALQRYYGFFPESFTKRTTREGGWYVWGNVADTEGALDAGFGFHWGPSGVDAVKWDREHGLLSMLYIEPDFYQQTMGDYTEAPTAEQAIERLRAVAAGDEAQLAIMEKLAYAGGYAPANWIAEHSLRESLQTISQAALTSVSQDAGGVPYTMIGQFPWMSESQWGCIFPNNLDPDIPNGKGWFNSQVYLDYNLRASEEAGAPFDGIGLDSLCGYGQLNRVNYRREHFQYADIPLSFAAADKKPVIVGPFGTVEWLRQLADEMHGRGLLLMTNCSWGMTPGWLTFGAPYLDIFGAESTQFADPDFIRAIAYRKPCTDLPYNPRPDWEMPWHLLHDIYPGHGNDLKAMAEYAGLLRELAAAGWEPITGVKADTPSLKVERYGTGGGMYLVVHNPTDQTISSYLAADMETLGLRMLTSPVVHGTGSARADAEMIFVELPPKGTVALEFRG